MGPDAAGVPGAPNVRPGPAIFAVSRRGLEIARRLQRCLGGDVRAPGALSEPGASDQPPTTAFPEGGIREAVAEEFAADRALVCVLPVGAVVRLVAPLLVDKRQDPAVIAIDEAGAHVVPVLSEHLGGANDLARRVAAAIGARPVITTAAEALGSIALDLMAGRWGWTLEDDGGMTRASAAVIDGEPVGCYQDAGDEAWWREAPRNIVRYASVEALNGARLSARLIISDRIHPLEGDGPALVFRPRTLSVGVGCVRGATAEEILDLIGSTLAGHRLAVNSVREIATIAAKREERGIREAAERRGRPLRFFEPAELAAAPAPSGVSAVVAEAVGAPAVCEPAALLAAGPGAELVAAKTRTPRVTVAVARVRASTRNGALSVVGIGPGAESEMTERARRTLESAEAVVGYDGYLDLIRPWLPDATYHGSPIGAEIERCRLAVALARDGRRVALVSSGDPGVYGTAGIVIELLAADGADDELERLEIVPGVSAASTAAALLGAPLMSDFATISLSDLMTPLAVIERRLEAAAASDMVIALYNPASRRRRAPLERAHAILLRHRDPGTPVGLVRNAARRDQQIEVTDLAHLLDRPIDMLTIVIVGNSATVRAGSRLTTRRGYAIS